MPSVTHGRRTAWTLGLTVLAAAITVACADDGDDAMGEGTQAGDCEDGADNDADGMFDCDDPGCMGSPVCGSADGMNDDGDGGDDGGGDCVTRDDVIVEGSYDVVARGDQPDCDDLIGGQLVCQVAQDECDVTTSCTIMGTPISFDGELKDRGGDNAHGYSGTASVMGFEVNFDIEFRCNQDPTCEFLDVAVISIDVPAGGLNCLFDGNLV